MTDGDTAGTWELLFALRTELIDQLAEVPAERWDTPSLCSDWRVRDVVAHTILPDHISLTGGFVDLARAGFNLGRYVHTDAVKRGSVPVDSLIAEYRAGIRRRTLPPARRPEHVLTDLFIHAQDIRRPLGLPWSYDPALAALVADTLTADRPLGAPKRLEGLRLRATDIDWSHGDAEADEVAGPVEALILAASGRGVALPELTGPGVETLTARIG